MSAHISDKIGINIEHARNYVFFTKKNINWYFLIQNDIKRGLVCRMDRKKGQAKTTCPNSEL